MLSATVEDDVGDADITTTSCTDGDAVGDDDITSVVDDAAVGEDVTSEDSCCFCSCLSFFCFLSLSL